jgi:serine/threonine-protein kinase
VTIDSESLRPRLAAALGDSLQLGELLGEGGFAAVFRAHDPKLQRDVAIKVLDPGLGIAAQLEEQFLSEARIVAGVEHPHIVPLYAAEARGGLLYLVMRLLPGRTLEDRIREEGALAPAEAARIAQEIAEALAFAHAKGVVHRDIKPGNILLDSSGNATVTDFGVSLVTGKAGADQIRGMTIGTPSYMSPEQGLGEDVDGRTDIYSLGVILFEMLSGRVPFQGRTIQELIAMHIAAPPPSLATLRPTIPSALVAIVERMLVKTPATRPDAAEVVAALAAARTPDALMSPAEVQRRRRRKRYKNIGLVVGTGVVSLVVVVFFVVKALVSVTKAVDSGKPPLLDAMGASIPDSIVAAARADGLLLPGEVPIYAFIPADGTAADALLFTKSYIIRRSKSHPRRFNSEEANVDIKFNKSTGKAGAGVLIARVKGEKPDTIYKGLSGIEFMRLRTSLVTLPSDDK